jgi:tungstate transport system substrate-binding protein
MTAYRWKRVSIFSVAMIALVIFAGCGAVPASKTADQASTSSAAAQSSAPSTGTSTPPTPIARTTNSRDLILSTTTSTQDSGLLDTLIPLFEQQSGYHVKLVAVGSGAAIALGQRGESDVVLAHAPDNEQQFVASGAGVDRQLVMYNDFILVGPADDPAHVQGTQDILAAMRTIADAQTRFVSRGDNSGTHQVEQKLWTAAEIDPQGQPWYVESGTGMGPTLQIANQRSAYTLSDRATYLAFKAQIDLMVALEGDPRLINVYHVITVNPARFPQVNAEGARAFSAFLLTGPTQQVIGNFGRDTFGQALFMPCAHNSCGLQNPDG